MYFGWAVVAAALVMMMVSAGLGFYNLTVYLRALVVEQGFSVGAVSGPTSVFFLVSGVAGLPVASLIARWDARYTVAGGAVIGGVALALLGRVTTLPQMYADYALFGAGFAATCLVPGTTVVTRWFGANRAVALSIALTGVSLGGIAITPLTASLITSRGLGAVTPWLGVAYVVGIVPITATLLRPGPRRPEAATGEPPPGTPLATALRSRYFVAVTGAYVLVFLAQVGGIAHLFSLVSERADEGLAALTVSAVALGAIVGRLAGGWILTRAPMRGFAYVMFAGQGLGLAALALSDGRVPLLASAVGFGLVVGNVLMLHALLLSDAFGVRDYPRIYAISGLVATGGFAFGPSLLGLLHDQAGGYTVAFLTAAAASVGGLFALALSGNTRRVGAGETPGTPTRA